MMSDAEPHGGEKWHRVAAVADLDDGGVIVAKIGEQHVSVYKSGGQLYAFDDVCPHAHAFLSDGWIEDDVIECTLHGMRFHIPTGRCVMPASGEPMTLFAVRAQGDDVEVRLTPP